MQYLRTQKYLIAILVILAFFLILGMYEYYMQYKMLDNFLYGADRTLKNDFITRWRARCILPKLISIHQNSLNYSYKSNNNTLINLNEFNKRITSWHAIVDIVLITKNDTGAKYVSEHLQSKAVLIEEREAANAIIDSERNWGKEHFP